MARQAGRLLAELRRASNEFRSQIETEISHLEVQKNEVQKNEVQKNQTALPPGQPPPGTLASGSLNPAAAESTPPTPELPATPVAESNTGSDSASNSASNSATEPIAEAGAPTSQASHV